jgi:hypothetical protein
MQKGETEMGVNQLELGFMILLGLVAVGIFLSLAYRKPKPNPLLFDSTLPPLPQYCTACGTTDLPIFRCKGSGLITFLLLLFFLLPGILYAMWRSTTRHAVCPRCGSSAVIPLDSPRAKAALSTQVPAKG